MSTSKILSPAYPAYPAYMTGYFGMVSLEMKRLFSSRRNIPVVLILIAGIIKAGDQLMRYSQVVGELPNIWDSYFAFYGSWSNQFLVLVVPLLFVLLVGDILIKDSSSRYDKLVLIRLKNKSTYWLAKVTAVLAAAFCFSLLILVLSLAIGMLRGLEFSWSLSELALSTQTPNMGKMAALNVMDIVIYPFSSPISPLCHAGTIILNLSIAYSLLAIAGIVIGIYASTLYAPLGLVVFTQMILQNYGLYGTNISFIDFVLYFINMVTDSGIRSPSAMAAIVGESSGHWMLFEYPTVISINVAVLFALFFLGWILYLRKEY